MKDIMLDLETMGSGNKAAIASIGAVYFSPKTGELGDTFYSIVDLKSCQKVGLHIDADNVYWWLSQEEEAVRELLKDSCSLVHALSWFTSFVSKGKGKHVWGSSSTFDNVILRNAYEALDLPCPWHYRGDRDVRTLVALVKEVCGKQETISREGTHHNSLHDAIHQVRYVSFGYKLLMGKQND
jgi:exodeoxyribonuclease VIII